MAARQRLAVGALAVMALVGADSAWAVSPQRIYKDLADNGRLDGRYRRADIARAFNLERVVRTDAGRPLAKPRRVVASRAAAPEKASSRTVPFTGLDLALLTVGGGPLILIGVGLRRRLAPAPGPARVMGS
jgi:hypothetical protein